MYRLVYSLEFLIRLFRTDYPYTCIIADMSSEETGLPTDSAGKPFAITPENLDRLGRLNSDLSEPLDQIMPDYPGVEAFFRLLDSSESKQLLDHLCTTVLLEKTKMEKGSHGIIHNPEPGNRLREYLATRFGFTSERIEDAFTVFEEAISRSEVIPDVSRLDDMLGVFANLIRIVYEDNRGDVPNVSGRPSRYEQLRQRSRERISTLTGRAEAKIAAEAEGRSGIVRRIESGDVPSDRDLQYLIADALTDTERTYLSTADLVTLEESLVYLSMVDTASDGTNPIPFERQAVEEITDQTNRMIDRMLDIWLRLGLIKIYPEEIHGKHQTWYYFATPHLSARLRQLLT